MMREHGGDIDAAIARFGGAPTEWIDLSTGINRVPYPVRELTASSWRDLPTEAARQALIGAARTAYDTQAAVLPLAGAQAAIQLMPRLDPAPGRARVLAASYNEHAAALRAAGWTVQEVTRAEDLGGADLAVLVNPNNPDGTRLEPGAVQALARRVGRLVVDESFADPTPAISVAPDLLRPDMANVLVLRSFGKFYGLAGLRLGFALGAEETIAALSEMAGPWPVSGAALAIGAGALADRAWAEATAARLGAEADRLDRLAAAAGWRPRGGTALFRLYDTPDAAAARTRLARARIWTRAFGYSTTWLRLGLPGTGTEWDRLATALEG